MGASNLRFGGEDGVDDGPHRILKFPVGGRVQRPVGIARESGKRRATPHRGLSSIAVGNDVLHTLDQLSLTLDQLRREIEHHEDPRRPKPAA